MVKTLTGDSKYSNKQINLWSHLSKLIKNSQSKQTDQTSQKITGQKWNANVLDSGKVDAFIQRENSQESLSEKKKKIKFLALESLKQWYIFILSSADIFHTFLIL